MSLEEDLIREMTEIVEASDNKPSLECLSSGVSEAAKDLDWSAYSEEMRRSALEVAAYAILLLTKIDGLEAKE